MMVVSRLVQTESDPATKVLFSERQCVSLVILHTRACVLPDSLALATLAFPTPRLTDSTRDVDNQRKSEK